MANNPAVISVRHLQKWYSGVHALKGVSIDFRPHENVGLVGDNGAGKSTLISILSGLTQPDSGTIWVDDHKVELSTPRAAMALGIETIHQHQSTVPTMDIARNFFIGREPLKWSLGGFGWLDRRRMYEETTAALARLDMPMRSPDTLVSDLSGGQRQGVAIARAMYFQSKVMILDEPTNHLSVKETNRVIHFIRGLPEQRMTGVFVSHNLEHVFACCDRILVMALGQLVFDKPTSQTSIDEVKNAL